MTSGHLVTYGDLSLLRDVDPYRLVHARRKFISVLSCEHFGVHYDTIFTVGYFQGGIPYLTCLLTEDGAQQALLCRKFCLSLRSHLSDKDITCTDFRTDADDASLVKIFQSVVTDTRDISCDLLRSQFCISRLCLIFLDMDRSVHVILYQSLAQQDSVLVVVTFPCHESDQRVLSESHLSA